MLNCGCACVCARARVRKVLTVHVRIVCTPRQTVCFCCTYCAYDHVLVYGSVYIWQCPINSSWPYLCPKSSKKYLDGTKQIYEAHVDFVGITVGAAGSTGRQSSSDLPISGMLQNTVWGTSFCWWDQLGIQRVLLIMIFDFFGNQHNRTYPGISQN